MNCISLWQPWASLYVEPTSPKIYETRHWPTTVRGWTLIHAAKRPNPPDDPAVSPALAVIARRVFGDLWRRMLPLGCVVGAVKIDHCQPCDQVLRDFLAAQNDLAPHPGTDYLHVGDFSDGRYAWRRSDAIRFEDPIPFVGRQRFFQVPASALPAHVRQGLEVSK